jgi:hypothetical protein
MNLPEPLQQIMRIVSGYWTSQVLYVAAKLGIADLLKEGPKTADELASSTQTHPRSLYRFCRVRCLWVFWHGTNRNAFR